MAPVLGISEKIAEAPVTLGPFLAYVIIRRADGKAIGDAGFHGPPTPKGEVELGYAVVPVARRQGYAREAVELLIDWAKEQPGVRAMLTIAQGLKAHQIWGLSPRPPQAYVVYVLALILVWGISFLAGTMNPKRTGSQTPPPVTAPQR